MKMTVSLVCETYITEPSDGSAVTRNDITCRIIYCSTSESPRARNESLIASDSPRSQSGRLGPCLSAAGVVQTGVPQVLEKIHSVRDRRSGKERNSILTVTVVGGGGDGVINCAVTVLHDRRSVRPVCWVR